MIGRLKGIVGEKKPPFLIVDVGGVGYVVETSMNTFYQLPELGESVTLHIHFVVREDAQLLFGFIDDSERRLFRSLIKISGVGPKMALAILSSMVPNDFIACVSHQDIKQLTRIPGVGKKTAQRLCIEIRDYLKDWQSDMTGTIAKDLAADMDQSNQQQRDAIDALISLGYKPQDASRIVKKVAQDGLSSEQLIRLSLQAI